MLVKHYVAAAAWMMPGVFLFRMASGLMQLAGYFDVLRATIADAMTAIAIICRYELRRRCSEDDSLRWRLDVYRVVIC